MLLYFLCVKEKQTGLQVLNTFYKHLVPEKGNYHFLCYTICIVIMFLTCVIEKKIVLQVLNTFYNICCMKKVIVTFFIILYIILYFYVW